MYSSAFERMARPPQGGQHQDSHYYDDGDVGVSRQYERKVVRKTRQDHDDRDDFEGDFDQGGGVLDDRLYAPSPEVVSTRTTHSSHRSQNPRNVTRSSRTVGHRPEFVHYHESKTSHGDAHSYPRASREVQSDFETFHESKEPYFPGGTNMKKPPGGKKMLKKVQHELEAQRDVWAEEVGKLTNSPLVNPVKGQGKPQGSNSYVDTRSGVPIFKAFVDVSEFPPQGISVSVDNVQNKVVVRAEQKSGGTINKTFTQKVQLPRYADEANVRSFMSKSGVLKLEVPLMFYFPMYALQKDGTPAKSFVNEIRTRPDGQQCLEILVNTGTEYRARDLHVRVIDDDKLVISASKPTSSGQVKQKVIKQYTLPRLADVDAITSKLAKDGRLAVTVPLKRSSRGSTPTMSPPLSPTR